MGMIISATGLPFTDRTAAELKASVITAELGEVYEVIDHPDGGFAVTKKNGAATITGASSSHEEKNLNNEVSSSPVLPMSRATNSNVNPWDLPEKAPDGKLVNTKIRAKQTAAPFPVAGKPAAASLRDNGDDLHRTIRLHPALASFWLWYVVMGLGILTAFSPHFFLAHILNVGQNYVDSMSTYGLIPMVSMIGVISMASALLNMTYGYYVRRYQVGPDMIETFYGLVSRKMQRIEYRHIRSVNVDQGLIGRLLNYGMVEISTAANEGGDLIFNNVADPTLVQEQIYRRKKTQHVRKETEEDE